MALAGVIAGAGTGGITEDEKTAEPLDEVEDIVLDDSSDGIPADVSVGAEGAIEVKAQESEKVNAEPAPATETFVVTAYTAGAESTGKTPSDPAYGLTASGEYVQQGRTIACPPSMPFGTTLHIEGIGERVCEDRGSGITEGRIDVYMDGLEEALEFGRQDVEVRTISEGER